MEVLYGFGLNQHAKRKFENPFQSLRASGITIGTGPACPVLVLAAILSGADFARMQLLAGRIYASLIHGTGTPGDYNQSVSVMKDFMRRA